VVSSFTLVAATDRLEPGLPPGFFAPSHYL